ncbi:MAG: uncharacterized protein QOH69_335 [Actinomycetota bacterium]|jgi:predicted enzyme related to lactoylglutathione lyase|nr:uncharacterized protein [Actinomycetota bacterium]
MGNPVVHFEISGRDPKRLREYYSQLFDWEFDTDSPRRAIRLGGW